MLSLNINFVIMNQIDKILVPTDFSPTADNALRYAMWLASQLDADIHILHIVFPVVEAIDAPGAMAAFVSEQIKTAKTMLQLQVDRVTTQVNIAHEYTILPNIDSDIRTGSVISQITDCVEEASVDLIVMGTQGEHSLLERILGSTSSAIVRRANCPVLVVPSQVQEEKLDVITYASDLSGTEPFQIWETRNILAPLNPALKMFHVCTPDEDPNSRKLQELKQFFTESEFIHPISFCTAKAEKSQIAAAINQYVKQQGTDLLIMFRPDRSLLEHLLHHSVTRDIVLSTEVPVLVIK